MLNWKSINKEKPVEEGLYLVSDGDNFDLANFYKDGVFLIGVESPVFKDEITHFIKITEPKN